MTDPILIAGAGPTGLTAAFELTRLGIPVRLIDKRAEPAATSRALGVQARTLELFDHRGLAAEMVRLGNPASGGIIYADGEPSVRIDFRGIDSRFNFILFLSQAETERVLAEALGRYGVGVERGVELAALAQGPEHEATPARAVLRHPDGRLERTEAPWLIGADGAHSLVRTTLALPFEGETLDQHYALADLQVDGPLSDAEFHIFSSRHGFMGLFPLRSGHFRLIASHPPGDPGQAAAPSLEALQHIYDQRSAVPARLRDLHWSTWFRINSRMVGRLKAGRFLLGGDAAHVHSPAGGQGMNTGIQDMINLAWKLALVLKGEADPGLLDTYEQERLSVMRGVLFRTEKLTQAIGSENPLFRTLFDQLAPFVGGVPFVQRDATRRLSQIALHYTGSPLSLSRGPVGALRAGERLPDMPVRLGGAGGALETSLAAVLDPARFTLLAVPPDGATADALAAAARPWDGLVAVAHVAPAAETAADERFQAAFGRVGGAFLVRPDGYLALTSGWRTAPAQLRAWCRKWLHAPR